MPETPPLGVTAVMLPELAFEEQIQLLQDLGVTHYTYRPRHIPEAKRNDPPHSHGNHVFDLTPERLAEEGETLRRRLEEAGLVPFGTVPATNVLDDEATLDLHFRGAAAAGAGRVRVGPPGYKWEPFDYEALLEKTHEAYGRVIELARRYGLKLVIETHANSIASGPGMARAICKPFDPADLGVIFDLPNYAHEGNLTPPLAVNTLKPWIDHCHVGGNRRVTTGNDAQGFRLVDHQMCALTEGDLYFPAWLAALREAEVNVPLVIEDYAPNMSGRLRLERGVADIRRALEAQAS